LDLLAYCGLISRQIAGQLGELGSEQTAHRKYEREGDHDHAHHSQTAWNAQSLNQSNQRRQHEAEQDGQRYRNDDLATIIQHHDNDRGENGHRHGAQ
jgi:hypothetical protein